MRSPANDLSLLKRVTENRSLTDFGELASSEPLGVEDSRVVAALNDVVDYRRRHFVMSALNPSIPSDAGAGTITNSSV